MKQKNKYALEHFTIARSNYEFLVYRISIIYRFPVLTIDIIYWYSKMTHSVSFTLAPSTDVSLVCL